MSNRTNPNTLLPISVFLLAMVGTTFAETSLLFPFQVGVRTEFNRRDSIGNEWTVVFEVDGQMTAKSFTYFHLQTWNKDNDEAFEDEGYFRLTEEALYGYNPTGEDRLRFQKAPVGTKWSFYREDEGGFNYKVIEIVDIGPVTVPYGTFDTAYVHLVYDCVDPDDLSKGKSLDWHEWIVPGIGMVKAVDHWGDNPPLTMELVRVIIPADIDIDLDTLNLRSKAKWIKCYIRLPEGYDVADIDPKSILLNGEVAPDRCRLHKAKQMLIVRFYRSEVQAIVEPGEVELTVSGEFTDGTNFEGADTITVIDKGGKK